MKFLFIDESENKEKDIPYFLVLAGLLIDSKNIFDVSEKMSEVKNKYKIVNLKQLRGKNFERSKRLKITEELVEVLKDNNAKIISIIEIPNNVKSSGEILKNKLYCDAVYLISERATFYSYKNNEKWILVSDILSCKESVFKEIKEKIAKDVRGSYTFTLKIGDFMFETSFFVEDELSNFIQQVDLIALAVNHAIREYYKKNNFPINLETLNNYSEYLNCYWSLFDRSPEGKIEGWGIKMWWYNE